MGLRPHGSRRRSAPPHHEAPATTKRRTMETSLYLGIISGERRRDHAEVAGRAARIAGGLHRLGVSQGDSVCILMRNDIAFIEAAYGAMRLGAYRGAWQFDFITGGV